jgi:hypothetical protein
MRRLLGLDYVHTLELQVREAGLLAEAESQAKALMRQRHRVGEENADAYESPQHGGSAARHQRHRGNHVRAC